ncbi:hypothetical protein R6Q57_003608 [Mikania cordata]
MRCKKHYNDLSSIVGVCASCLRERLLSHLAAQEQAQAQIQNLDGRHRSSDHNPAIHRSVSPYIHDRKRNQSVRVDNNFRNDNHHPYPPATSRHRHSLSDQLFYRTPQVRPVSGVDNAGVNSSKKRSFFRFLSFSNIFRSRNRKSVDSVSDLRESDSTIRQQCVDESTFAVARGAVRRQHCRDRGMSPVRNSDVDGGDEFINATREYESTESWKNTPRRTPARRGGGGHRRNLAFCLSPLVRATPNRQWSQKGLTPDGVLSGEIRAPVNPQLSNTKASYANRSRKIADFGRSNLNR